MSGAPPATTEAPHSPPAPRHPGGRPKVWTDERRDAAMQDVLDRLAAGQSLTVITAQPELPAWETLRQWLRTYPEFAAEYARAREEAAHMMAATVLDVADEVRKGKLDAAAGRTVVDALKWAAAKHAPKVYGEQSDSGVNVNVHVTPGMVIDLTPEPANGPPVLDGTTVEQLPAPSERADPPDVV